MKNLLTMYLFLQGKKSISRLKCLMILLLSNVCLTYAQPGPVLEWRKTYAGSGVEFVSSWVETTDGYILGGQSNSPAGGAKSENTRGEFDYWIVKIDKAGNKIWDKTYGGTGGDYLKVILKAPDGFYLGGNSNSPAGADKSESSLDDDFWVIKINSNGQKIWDKTFGGSEIESISDAVITPDNNILIGGSSNSPVSGNKTSTPKSVSPFAWDFWIIKITPDGNKLWDKSYGGALFGDKNPSGNDFLETILLTLDNGIILFGGSNSHNGEDKTTYYEGSRYWSIKINSEGDKIWDQSYGRDDESRAEMMRTQDNKYVIVSLKTGNGENGTFYGNFILRELDLSGNEVWSKEFNTFNDSRTDVMELYDIAKNGNSFSLLYKRGKVNELFITNINFDGKINYTKEIPYFSLGVSFMEYSSLGEVFIGYTASTDDYVVEKYKAPNSAPNLNIRLRSETFPNLSIWAYPNFISDPVTKIELFIDGNKLSEDLTAPYYFEWQESGVGDHLVQTKAYTSTGQIIESPIVTWKVFANRGYQGESYTSIAAEYGQNPVGAEEEATLIGGAALRLWDVGDQANFLIKLTRGKYLIKARVRSGMYALNSSYSNPTAYFDNGYSFFIGNTLVQFTGDPSTVSAKNPAFGGSYWGTMTGEFTTENEGDYYLSIKALKAWAGVDYIEVVPWQVVRVEAEISYSVSVDTGTRPIGRVGSTTFSEGYSVKIWDKGDEMKIEFFSYEGDYVIKPRVRSGSYSSTSSYANPTDYWPNGYSFKLDNQAVSFTGDISTISGRDASYGGSYWGTMNSGKIHISQGIHYLYIKANKEWAGVDYFDLVPAALTSSSVSSRVAAEENPLSTDATKYEVFPNPFRNALTISLPKPTSGNSQLSLTDPYGKIYFKQSRQLKGEATMELNLNDPQIKPGMYILKVKTQIGEKNYRLIKE